MKRGPVPLAAPNSTPEAVIGIFVDFQVILVTLCPVRVTQLVRVPSTGVRYDWAEELRCPLSCQLMLKGVRVAQFGDPPLMSLQCSIPVRLTIELMNAGCCGPPYICAGVGKVT